MLSRYPLTRGAFLSRFAPHAGFVTQRKTLLVEAMPTHNTHHHSWGRGSNSVVAGPRACVAAVAASTCASAAASGAALILLNKARWSLASFGSTIDSGEPVMITAGVQAVVC